MVEQQPSKLNTRVRFPSPAPNIFNGLGAIFDLIPTSVKVILATRLNTFPILPMFSVPRIKISPWLPALGCAHQLLLLFRFRACAITADRRQVHPKFKVRRVMGQPLADF
jgi:hypothetical protein